MRTIRIEMLALGLCAGSGWAAPCGSLAALHLKNGSITQAEAVGAGEFRTDDGRPLGALPAFCRVSATLKPSSDSEIKIEVWLPAENWNGKLRANGNGGW